MWLLGLGKKNRTWVSRIPSIVSLGFTRFWSVFGLFFPEKARKACSVRDALAVRVSQAMGVRLTTNNDLSLLAPLVSEFSF